MFPAAEIAPTALTERIKWDSRCALGYTGSRCYHTTICIRTIIQLFRTEKLDCGHIVYQNIATLKNGMRARPVLDPTSKTSHRKCLSAASLGLPPASMVGGYQRRSSTPSFSIPWDSKIERRLLFGIGEDFVAVLFESWPWRVGFLWRGLR